MDSGNEKARLTARALEQIAESAGVTQKQAEEALASLAEIGRW